MKVTGNMGEIIGRTTIEREPNALYYIKFIDNKLCIGITRNYNRFSGKYKDKDGVPISLKQFRKDYTKEYNLMKQEERALQKKLLREYKLKQEEEKIYREKMLDINDTRFDVTL
jgi:hypothetical protein